MQKQEEERERKLPLKEWIAFLTALIPFLDKIFDKSCGDVFLTWVLIALLFFSLIFLFITLLPKLRTKNLGIGWFIAIMLFLIYFMFARYLYLDKCNIPKQLSNNNSKTVFNTDKGTVNNDNSVHIEDNRKTYNSQTPSTRKLSKADKEKLKLELPDLDAKIIVQYLKTNSEDTLLWKGVIQILKEKGYSNIEPSEASILPNGLTKGNLTILKVIIDQQNIYKVIINPQR